MGLIRELWNDEAGLVLSAEAVTIGTIGVLSVCVFKPHSAHEPIQVTTIVLRMDSPGGCLSLESGLVRVSVMESTLHRQLKLMYGGTADDVEVQVDGFRIDAVVNGKLYEIQQASLGALRYKVRALLERYQVIVVKPLASRKLLVRRSQKNGPIVSSRYSPARDSIYHLFVDLVYFVDVFPHKRLTIEVVLTEQEEHRITKVKRRRFGPDYRVVDRCLTQLVSSMTLRTLADLRSLLPKTLPASFTTEDLARSAGIPRWIAQKMAYCLRKTGAVDCLGKQGRAMLYALPKRKTKRAA